MDLQLPDPLYETHLETSRMCLVCAKKYAKTVLRTTEKEIVPICEDCSCNWNFYGYEILKKIKPVALLFRTIKFKILHPCCSLRTIRQDIKNLQIWGKKMKIALKRWG